MSGVTLVSTWLIESIVTSLLSVSHEYVATSASLNAPCVMLSMLVYLIRPMVVSTVA